MVWRMAPPTQWTFLTRKRIAAGHTMSSLALAVGVRTAQISRLEGGLRGPSPGLYRLAEALNVDIDDLIATAPRPVPRAEEGDPDPVAEVVAS